MLELLAPAGSMEAVAAAVQNGADAVYLGYGDFNARRNAKNFSEEEFAAAVSYCHIRGARVYLTLNTLLTDRELPAAEDFAARVHDQALLEAIEAYVSGLDPGEQAVFRLRIYGEKTFPEIAASLRESEAAVKSRYYRLIGRLRKEFGSDEI